MQRRDPVSGRVLDQMIAGAGTGGLGAGDTEAMEFAPDGTAWIAGGTGLAQWDRVHGRFTAVTAMGRARVHAFAFDGSDGLWLHRMTGLERYQRNGAAWRRTATRDGSTRAARGRIGRVAGRSRASCLAVDAARPVSMGSAATHLASLRRAAWAWQPGIRRSRTGADRRRHDRRHHRERRRGAGRCRGR